MQYGGTIVDIYRSAKELWNVPGANQTSIQQAVNVARFFQTVPVLRISDYNNAQLVWHHNNVILTFEFIEGAVKVVLCQKYSDLPMFEGIQYHSGNIPIGTLYFILQSFCVIAGIPAIKLEPWDDLENTSVPDIDLSDAIVAEAKANEVKIATFRAAREEAAAKDKEKAAEKEDIVVEADIEPVKEEE